MRRLVRRHTPAVAALTALLTIGLASPAAAASLPWPEDGFRPTCDDVEGAPSGGSDPYWLAYTDDTWPTIGPVTWAKGKRTIVVGPQGKTDRLQARMKDSCSGVAGALAYLQWNDNPLTGVGLGVTVDDGRYFDVVAHTDDETFMPDYAGVWQVPLALVADRFSSFVLNHKHQWVEGGETARGGTKLREVGSVLYILKQTRASIAASKTVVKKGAVVSITGTVRKAADGSYESHAGAKVVLQRKTGSGAWQTVVSKTASGSGAVSAKVTVSKTSAFRWLVKADKTSLYTAPSTSKSVKVGVK